MTNVRVLRGAADVSFGGSHCFAARLPTASASFGGAVNVSIASTGRLPPNYC
jgi:hypothetical protein